MVDLKKNLRNWWRQVFFIYKYAQDKKLINYQVNTNFEQEHRSHRRYLDEYIYKRNYDMIANDTTRHKRPNDTDINNLR